MDGEAGGAGVTIDWTCELCGEDLGENRTTAVASGDCAECGRILCEGCFDYDEATATVTCPPGRCRPKTGR